MKSPQLSPLAVFCVNYWYSPDLGSGAALLDRYQSLRGWVDGLASADIRVSVFQRFWQDEEITRGNAVYHLISDGWGPRLRRWQIPFRLHGEISRLANALVTGKSSPGSLDYAELAGQLPAVVVHLNGMLFPVQARHIRSWLPRQAAMVVQHHSDRPWKRLPTLIHRWGLAGMDGFLFTARTQARPWLDNRVIRDDRLVFEVMEGSNSFQWQDRVSARAITGWEGDPVLLWVGNLIDRKDPLVVLRGFETVLSQRPAARLYLLYHTAELLPQIEAYLAGRPGLRQGVHLVGHVAYSQMANYHNSADYFVLGSHYEGSGFALAEALACGVIPVVTDIPSFRMMTGQGTIGGLWQAGDAASFSEVLLAVMTRPIQAESAAARAYFDDQLSYPAIGRQAGSIYRQVLEARPA